jgi:hypothetical protein
MTSSESVFQVTHAPIIKGLTYIIDNSCTSTEFSKKKLIRYEREGNHRWYKKFLEPDYFL